MLLISIEGHPPEPQHSIAPSSRNGPYFLCSRRLRNLWRRLAVGGLDSGPISSVHVVGRCTIASIASRGTAHTIHATVCLGGRHTSPDGSICLRSGPISSVVRSLSSSAHHASLRSNGNTSDGTGCTNIPELSKSDKMVKACGRSKPHIYWTLNAHSSHANVRRHHSPWSFRPLHFLSSRRIHLQDKQGVSNNPFTFCAIPKLQRKYVTQ